MTTPSRRLLRNLNWVVAVNAVAGLGNFIAIAWFAHVLGPGTMGDYAVVVTAIQLLTAFMSAGFDQAVIRSPHDDDIAAAAGIATLVQSLLLVASSACVYTYLLISAPVQASGILAPAALILTAIIFTLFANLLAAPIAASLDYRFLALSRLASTAIGIIAGLALASHEFGLYALAVRDVLTGFTMLMLCRLHSGGGLPWRTNRQGLWRLFDFTKGLWALNLTERLVFRLDYGVVGLLLGKEALGTYFVVRGIVEGALGFLVNPIQTVLFAHYCQSSNETVDSLSGLRLVPAYIVVCVGAATLAWGFGPGILNLLVGSAYAAAGAMLPALVIYAGAILWFENEKVLAMSRHSHHRVVYARLFQIAVFFILVFPAVNNFGIVGASLATAAGGITLAVTSTRLARTGDK